MNPKQLKFIARRLRATKRELPPLCHILINIRSWWTDYELKKLLKESKGLEWEYGVKNAVVNRFNYKCFSCNFHRPTYGHKTYISPDGKVSSYHPDSDSLPF